MGPMHQAPYIPYQGALTSHRPGATPEAGVLMEVPYHIPLPQPMPQVLIENTERCV